jgi:hypothetical protein
MPRSPQTTTRSIPKRRLIRSSAEGSVLSSWILPSKTSTATGRPSGEQVSPYWICSFPFLPSRG